MTMLENLFSAYLQLSLAMTPVLLLLWFAAGRKWTDRLCASDRRLLWCVITLQLLLPLASLVPRPITVPLPSEIPVLQPVYMTDGESMALFPAETEPAPSADDRYLSPETAGSAGTEARIPAGSPETDDAAEPAPAVPSGTGETVSGMTHTEPARKPSVPVSVQTAAPAEQTSVTPPVRLYTVLALVWICGAVWTILRHICSYIGFCLRLRRNRMAVPAEIRRLYRQICREMGIRRGPRLIRCGTDSPMLLGCVCPTLCLPLMEFTEEELSPILRHELTHFCRGDLFWKWLAMAAGALHWFHPMVQWAVRRADLVTELACDEAVLAALNDAERLTYGEVILSILSHRQNRTGTLLTTHFTPRKGKTRDRILYIINKPARRRARAAVLAAVILSVTAGMVGCQAEAGSVLPESDTLKDTAGDSTPIWADYTEDLPVPFAETTEAADITIPLVWREAVPDQKPAEMAGEYREQQLHLISGMVIRTYETDENGVTPAVVLVDGREIVYYDAARAEPYRIGDPEENVEGFRFVSWTGDIPAELEHKWYLLRDGTVMVTDLRECAEPLLPEQKYRSAYRDNEYIEVVPASEPREDGAEYMIWYSGKITGDDTIRLTEKHTMVNDWNCTFIPMDENPGWMLQYRMAADTLEIVGREKTISIDNSAVRKSHTETIRFFSGSVQTRFYVSPDERLAVITTPIEDRVTMDHMLLVNLETGEVIRYLENPYSGEHGAWLEKHGLPAEYADYGVEKLYDLNGLHVGWTHPDYVARSDAEWNGDLLYLFHSLASGDGEILLTGYQILYLNNWVLSGYQAGETRVPAGTVLTEGMTESLWIRENLYTDFGFRTEEADVGAMSGHALEAHMEEAYRAALGIFALSDVTTQNMQWSKTGEPVVIDGRSYSPMNNPLFPDYGTWERYVRRVLSGELADDLLGRNLYVGYSGELYGQLTARTLVSKFRDNGHTIQRIDEDTIRFIVHLDTVDMQTGGVLQTREFPFTYERTEDGWRWTYFKLLN